MDDALVYPSIIFHSFHSYGGKNGQIRASGNFSAATGKFRKSSAVNKVFMLFNQFEKLLINAIKSMYT
jgi:hypothetical protein